MQNRIVDYEARKSAALAKQQIDKHEEHCGERWKAANDTMHKLERAVEKLHSRINAIHRMGWTLTIAVLAYTAVQWFNAKGLTSFPLPK